MKDITGYEGIRALWATGEYLQRELASMFNTPQGLISGVVNNKVRRVF